MSDDFWGEPVSIYTRAQALADGTLVDLTEQATPFGFKIPMACTETVWNTLAWSDTIEERKPHATGQSTAGRLHDALTMARMAANAAAQAGQSVVDFDMLLVPREGAHMSPEQITLRLIVSGGDNAEPVLTLLFPGEE